MQKAVLWHVCAIAFSCGCQASLHLKPAEDSPRWLRDHAHTTILYSGVRDDAERFADYSVVDRRIVRKKE